MGKTAAARLVLEAAKENSYSPFSQQAQFVEMDATICRFDERSIADPLIGSVHDPIYQGAGALGLAGIPQPKPGAVTKAHGGILFIDEIGELHPVQINKLLKVLEDRKVFLESAYYSPEEKTYLPTFTIYFRMVYRLIFVWWGYHQNGKIATCYPFSMYRSVFLFSGRGRDLSHRSWAVEKIGMVIEEGPYEITGLLPTAAGRGYGAVGCGYGGYRRVKPNQSGSRREGSQ